MKRTTLLALHSPEVKGDIGPIGLPDSCVPGGSAHADDNVRLAHVSLLHDLRKHRLGTFDIEH